MRLTSSYALLALLAPLFTSCLGTGHSVNVYGGSRELDSDAYGSLDRQSVYGADLVWKIDVPFTAVEGGILHAKDDSGGLELSNDEYFLGVRITPWEILISPYAAAGVSYVDTSLDGLGTSDSDSAVGYYLRVGAAVNFAMFRVGLDGRALYGSDVKFNGVESDVDGLQLTAFIGIGF